MEATTISQRIRIELGKRVQPEYPAERLTMGEVAARTGVSKATVCRFLQGKPVDSNTLDRLAAFVGQEVAL